MHEKSHRTAREIFAIPAFIALLSAVGLGSALIGDDIWDMVSWAVLFIPIAVCAIFILAARRR